MKNDVVNVLNVLPVLLHYNSPNLPGYRSNSVPFGIDRFTPTEYQRRYLIDHGIDPDTKEENIIQSMPFMRWVVPLLLLKARIQI